MTESTAHTYICSLSYADKLLYVVADWNAAKFAYERLAVHRAGAVAQMDRLSAALASESLAPLHDNVTHEEMRAYVADGLVRITPALYEAHYYFVAWANCGRMLKIVAKQPEFSEALKAFDMHWEHFKNYSEARHSFEHFHDRLPGEKDSHRVKTIQPTSVATPIKVYWGFEAGAYKHSDHSWDVTPNSLALLTTAIDETLALVHKAIDEQIKLKYGA